MRRVRCVGCVRCVQCVQRVQCVQCVQTRLGVGEYQAPKLDGTFTAAVAAGFELPRRRYGGFGDVDRCRNGERR